MKKKFTAIIAILCVLCLLSLFCACQKDGKDLPSGQPSGNISSGNISSGNTGNGNLPSGTVVIDENNQNPPIDDNIDYSKALTIEGTTLTGLTDYGKTLSRIVVPEGVTEIGEKAFLYCTNLIEIELPNSLISIGDVAFADCISLLDIKIPTSLQKIGGSVFVGCYNLVIRYEDSAFNIEGGEMFFYIGVKEKDEEPLIAPIIYNCKDNLKANDGYIYVIADNGIQYALKDGLAMVTGHSKISGNIKIAENILYKDIIYKVQEIDYYAFCFLSLTEHPTYPSEITSIYLPNSITNIKPAAFAGCSKLTSIEIPSSVTSIGYGTFWGCSSLTSIEIPSGVTSIGDYAFEDCSSLTGVYITDLASWCAIEFGSSNANPLYYAHNLYLNNELVTELKIPDGVTSIGEDAFSDCSSLTSIEMPSSVTSIGSSAFSGCSSLKGVYITDLASWCAIEFGNNIANPLFYARNLYLNKELVTELKIPDGATSIGSYVFSGYSNLISIEIPSSVTRIGSCAFNVCTNLTRITFGENSQLTSIGYYAFADCISLISIEIPSGVTSIGDRAFYYCSDLKSIAIPSSVTSIGEYAFYNCSSLTIYCEASSKPSGWNSYWNYSYRPVVWGHK